jgi:hypothetical protein
LGAREYRRATGEERREREAALKGPYRCPRCDGIITIDGAVWWTGELGQMTRCKRCGVTLYRNCGQEKRGRAKMQRRLSCAVALIVAVLTVLTGAASASGPAPPGKDVIHLTCVGIGPVTVSVPRSESNNGVGQLVGAKGHGIPVAFTATITDVTTNTILGSDSSAVGHGHGHPNQTATTCSGVVFLGPASAFFGGGLPPGVAPTDTIQVSIVGQVIVKL